MAGKELVTDAEARASLISHIFDYEQPSEVIQKMPSLRIPYPNFRPVNPEQSARWATILQDPQKSQLLVDTVNRVLDEVALLNSVDKQVLELRYGLNDGLMRTYDEISEMFGVTRNRIRVREHRVIRRLRRPQRSELLRPFLPARD